MQALTFTQQLILTIADKLLIAAVLVLVGYWLNKRLEQFKSHEAEKLQVLKGQQDGLIAIFKGNKTLDAHVPSGYDCRNWHIVVQSASYFLGRCRDVAVHL